MLPGMVAGKRRTAGQILRDLAKKENEERKNTMSKSKLTELFERAEEALNNLRSEALKRPKPTARAYEIVADTYRKTLGRPPDEHAITWGRMIDLKVFDEETLPQVFRLSREHREMCQQAGKSFAPAEFRCLCGSLWRPAEKEYRCVCGRLWRLHNQEWSLVRGPPETVNCRCVPLTCRFPHRWIERSKNRARFENIEKQLADHFLEDEESDEAYEELERRTSDVEKIQTRHRAQLNKQTEQFESVASIEGAQDRNISELREWFKNLKGAQALHIGRLDELRSDQRKDFERHASRLRDLERRFEG